MVSFFGLKFGGDKKKPAQNKDVGKKSTEKWTRTDQNAMGQGQYSGHNFSRPTSRMAPRPETSYSTKSPTNWRATFRGLGANSSMVDLTAPSAPMLRKQSVSSLRQHTGNGSSGHLPLPSSLPGGIPRVGTPDRPWTASSRTKEWVNPLDVHFCKSSSTTVHSTNNATTERAIGESSGNDRSSSEEKQADTARGHADDNKPEHEREHEHATLRGYPSPPASVENGEQPSVPLSPKRSATDTQLREQVGPTSLPSPATSATRSSADKWETPVVRNVLARRDTTTFYSPRRRSFVMDIEAKPEELQQLRKLQRTEGFAGNFSAFDFGESVKRQTCIETPVAETKPSKEIITDEQSIYNKNNESAAPLGRTISADSNGHSATLEAKSAAAMRFDLQKPAKAPPQLLSDATKFPAPPSERKTDAPARPVTSYGLTKRADGTPRAAAFARRGSENAGALDLAIPQGFMSHRDSDNGSRSRTGPPRPLRPEAPPTQARGEPSPDRNPFGPPVDENNYMVAGTLPGKTSAAMPSSPYARPPMEGDFPVTKGLPRGRQPPRRPPREGDVVSPGSDKIGSSLPDWGGFERSEPRRSAIPAPLIPARPHRPSFSSQTSAFAPQIHSPALASLELSLSDSADSLTAAFEQALEKSLLAPGLAGDFFSVNDDRSSNNKSPGGSSVRVDAKKAPPRPSAITVPPSPNKSTDPGMRSPQADGTEFRATFI